MKKAFLFAAALSASLAYAEPPGNLAAPLGLELGKTRCARLTPGPNRVTTGKAQWAGGDAIEIRNLERFNLPGLSRAIVNCDAQDTVALISLTFDRSALEDVTGKLNARYESKRKTEANAENAYAEWAAANGSLELLYARDGKQFTVAYWAKGAKAKYFAYSGTSSEKKPVPEAPAPKQPAPL
ncbi:hypothetical protein LMG23992_00782 [Cupriavidus laharis]|uniref:Uncharacterized protein n=1 Tax=Cupriavidus laharis TaxID=151654 RepID=A0ABM8WJJ4_9BURK|nr:hypothetical protein [Cupriavidus laharis]CAG9167329.1 hypothetical protein LMG23992_00782 [Cupriavidus laharis]